MIRFDFSEWEKSCVKLRLISKDLYKSLEKYLQTHKQIHDEVKKTNDKYNVYDDYHQDLIDKYNKYLFVFYWHKYFLEEYKKNYDLFNIAINNMELIKINTLNALLYAATNAKDKEKINNDKKTNNLLSLFTQKNGTWDTSKIGSTINTVREFDTTVRMIFLDLSIVHNYDFRFNFNSIENKDPVHIDVYFEDKEESFKEVIAKSIFYTIYDQIKDNGDILEAMSFLEKILGLSKHTEKYENQIDPRLNEMKDLVFKILDELNTKYLKK